MHGIDLSTSPLGSFYVRNPRDSLLADEGSAGLRSQGIHGRLSDKKTVNARRTSCDLLAPLESMTVPDSSLTHCGIKHKYSDLQSTQIPQTTQTTKTTQITQTIQSTQTTQIT